MPDTIESPALIGVANYIGGRWRRSASGESYAKANPAKPAEVTGRFPLSTQDDVDAAAEAAAGAFAQWAARPAIARGAVLQRAADIIEKRCEEIALCMTLEMGKPLREARLEAARVAAIFRFYGSEGWRPHGEVFEQAASGSRVHTLRRPLGVVALITPWNFPAAIPAWKLAPALAYGNTVVLKLAQDSPGTGLHLARALDDAGLPSGVLNVIIGRGAEIGGALVRHPAIRAVSFTGSVAVGEQVRNDGTADGKRVQVEMGGQNPLIIMADAQLDRAADAAYAGAFWSAGQKCTATRRIYVQDGVYEHFRALLLARMARAHVGDPSDATTEVGPVVNERQMTEVLEAIAVGRDQGGTVLAGGYRMDGDGYLVAPTLFEDVGDDAMLSREEVFGPVTSLYRFDVLSGAIERANDVEFGLSASIFTTSLAASRQFAAETQAGLLHVNSQTAGADIHVPFGGLKRSGFGPHEQGRAALEFYTDQVTLYEDL